jgi:hypothetical protein
MTSGAEVYDATIATESTRAMAVAELERSRLPVSAQYGQYLGRKQ